MKKILLLLCLMTSFGATAQEVVDTMYIYRSNNTVERIAVADIDSVTFVASKKVAPSFALLSAEGEEIGNIAIGTDATVWVTPVADFECSILSCPEWLDEPVALSGGYMLNVAQSFVPFAKEGIISFGNVDANVVFNVPVEYSGMNPAVMKIEGEYTPWWWKVSLDGKRFLQSAMSSNDGVAVENALVFSATCLEYDYSLFAVQVGDSKLRIMSAGDSWILAEQDVTAPSKVSVSVAPLESGSRSGYLFAVPAALCNAFVDSLNVAADVDEFIDANISFLMLEIEQVDYENSGGFVITDGNGAPVSCMKDEEYYEWLCSEFTVSDLTTCTLVPGERYHLDTKLAADKWQGNYAITDLEFVSQRLKLWGNPKAVLGDAGTYELDITVPASLEKTIILRLCTPNMVNLKVLVIRPFTAPQAPKYEVVDLGMPGV